MTLEAYSSLPLAAGSAMASAAGRGALRAIGFYMREPLRNTALVALVGLSAMAGSNVLYRQTHHLPQPLFGAFAETAASTTKLAKPTRPVLPAARPAKLVDDSETTGSLAPAAATPAPAAPVIGNDDVLALQKKLAALSFFSGTQDGLFGARTSKAIKAFEQSIGRSVRGQLTPQIIALIEQAPIPAPKATQPMPMPVAPMPHLAAQSMASTGPTTSVAPLAATPTKSPPAAVTAQPLPAPAPLLAAPTSHSVAAASEEAQPETAKLVNPDPAVASGTQSVAMNDAPTMSKRTVQTIAIRAQTGQPIPAQLAPAQTSDDASTDPDVVADVQRGLNSLGFLHGEIDGVAGETTAKAIRNFEVYYNYDVTGRITRQLVDLLKQNGAVI
jgi:peptidoglycan hydrolase-like protein with peptidoglycan-binding domain